MTRIFFVCVGFILMLGACTQKTICPAFQSAFIYDKETLRRKFSYFESDSTPKVFTASKNKYLIAEAMPYRKKISSMATIEMKDVNPVVPDSLSGDEEVSLEELDRAARSIIDSTYVVDVPARQDTVASEEDSVYVITKDKEVRVLRYHADSVHYTVDEVRYNIDQDNYMWYLRDVLVLPDVRAAQMHAKEKSEKEKKEKKGIKGFFKNLFKKKEKKQKQEEEVESDSTLTQPIEKSEFDFDYTDLDKPETVTTEEETSGRKGLFRKKKKDRSKTADANDEETTEKPAKNKKEKKSKVATDEVPEEEQPEVLPKEKDDGF